MNRFAWVNARTIPEAAALASTLVSEAMTTSQPDGAAAVVKAGGIDLLDLLKEDLLAPAKLINLRQVPGLDAIEATAQGGLRVGAMTTLAQLADNSEARRRYPALAEAAAGSASPELRQVATVGGNLLQRPRCWYFRAAEYRCLRKGGGHCFAIPGENQYHAIFDNQACAIVHPSTIATVLVALSAKVTLTDARNATRTLLVEEFLVGPGRDMQRESDLQAGEILTAVELPPLPPTVRMAHLRQAEKDSFDWPLADVAAVLDVAADGACTGASIVLGAAAPTPHRAKAAEAALVGKHLDDAVLRGAAHAALAGATPLAKNGYKLPLFETLVRRTIEKAVTSV